MALMVWEPMTPVEPDATWDVQSMVFEFASPDSTPWRDLFRAMWCDRKSSKRVRALVSDIAQRGEVCIPVVARRENDGRSWRIVDGVHRIAAAWTLMVPVPVIFKNENEEDS